MKKENGITLLSLIVYIVGIVIIMTIVILITNFFRENVLQMEDSSVSSAEFSKFNLSFIEEVKTYRNSISEIDNNHVTFSTGNTYLFQDNKIYKNKIPIADNIIECKFLAKTYETKQIVSVYMVVGDKKLAKTIDYVLAWDDEEEKVLINS